MQFTHEHLEIQKTLKRFIDEEINPHVEEWEAAEIFPAHQVFKRLGELGLLGLTKPEAYGGAGLDYSYAMAMAEALGHTECGGVPMAIGVQTDMATPALARFGSDELRRQFLAPAIAGDMVACIGVSEPGAGSDVAAIKSRAVKDGDDYLITGQKMWITNSLQADWMCMLVNTGEGPAHKNKSPGDRADARRAQRQAHQGHRGRAEDPQDRHELVRYRPDLLRRGARAAALPHRQRRPGLRLPDAAVPGGAAVGGGQLRAGADQLHRAGPSSGRSSARCSARRWPTSNGCSSSWRNSRPRWKACAR